MMIKRNKSFNKLDMRGFNKLGVFSLSLLTTSAAVYLFSPVLVSNADDATIVTANVDVGSIASISYDVENLEFNMTPTASGAFDSKAVTVTVNTNSSYGYELYFSSEDNTTSLVHSNPNVSSVIASDFSGTVTSSTMAANKWGYSLDNSSFEKIPAANAQAKIKDIDHLPTSSETDTSVYIGTKVSTSLTSGAYTKNVKFSVVAHEAPEPSATVFGGITKMQEMTPEICSAATVGDTETLTDPRDGNEYTVKKLADGRCWMTESLRLINKTISSADSNLPSGESWTVPASDITTFMYNYNTNSAYLDSTYGGYYSFYAATAGWGTDSVTSGNDAPKDICPKGWRLPTGDSSGEFQTLYNNYSSSELMQGTPGFLLSGRVYGGSTDYQGSRGYYWSSSVDGILLADGLRLGDYSAEPYTYHNKYCGFTIRCIAK